MLCPIFITMTMQELLDVFGRNHEEFISYISPLTESRYDYSYNGKWTAGQQLAHIHLCLQPFPRALSSKEFIREKFGVIDRPLWDYDTVIERYLQTSRKAPERFLPGPSATGERDALITGIRESIATIQQQLGGYTNEEMDTLAMPHPLLGNLTIREMFYLMAYHATHHLRQVQESMQHYQG